MKASIAVAIFALLVVEITAASVGEDGDGRQGHVFAFDDPDWIRCRGMPCDRYQELKKMVKQIKGMIPGANSTAASDNSTTSGNDTTSTGNDVTADDDKDDASDDENAIEGDIWLDLAQASRILEQSKRRHKRKLQKFDIWSRKWTMPIKIKIKNEFTDAEKAGIRGAMHHWEAHTCIRFEELDLYSFTYDPHIVVMKGDGCGTYIGRIVDSGFNPQPIMLSSKCIEQWGAVVHEFGHIIGFWHEHQRSDRDQYVDIFPHRMKSGADTNQFSAKGDTNNLLPYDYGSVMHYWAWTFSSRLEDITIMPKNALYLNTIGQKIELSFLDHQLANMAYCNATCRGVSLSRPCERKGYQDPNNCYRCKCPDGFTGQYCQDIEASKKGSCGGTIQLQPGEVRRISSPGWSHAISYDDRTECTWLAKAPQGYKVKLTMNPRRFNLYCYFAVCFHYLEVRIAAGLWETGPRYCCPQYVVKNPSLVSETNEMMVLFRSNFTTNSTRYRQGFEATLSLVRDGAQTPPPVPTTTITPFQPAPQPGGSGDYVDVAFVVDSSGSVGDYNWQLTKKFIMDVVRTYTVGPNHARFGVVSFGSFADTVLRFGQSNDLYTIKQQLDKASWKNQASNIAAGLREARTALFSSAENRGNAPDVCVLFTDGPSNAEEWMTQSEAQTLRQHGGGVHMIAVGITDRAIRGEVEGIASYPPSQNALFVNSYTALADIRGSIVSNINRQALTPPQAPRLCFLLDSSGSIKRRNWMILLQFVRDYVDRATWSSRGECRRRVAMVTFGNEATLDLAPRCHSDGQTVGQEIAGVVWKDAYTNTASALRAARQLAFAAEDGGSAPRQGDTVLLVTNGASNRERLQTLPEAELLRELGVRIFVVGVGDAFDHEEATQITSRNDSILRFKGFDELLQPLRYQQLDQWMFSGNNNNNNNTPAPNPLATQQTSRTTRTTPRRTTTRPTNSNNNPAYSWGCDFESTDDVFCGMAQDWPDKFDWTSKSGHTPSAGTGPRAAISGENYIYIETSAPQKENDNAAIATPKMPYDGPYCLIFHFHMFGWHVNRLEVYLEPTDGSIRPIFIREGEQNDEHVWFRANLTVTETRQGDRFVFNAIRGKGYAGDIALDDIKVMSCGGNNAAPNPVRTTTTTTTTAAPVRAFNWQCSFDDDRNRFCGMGQAGGYRDDFDWTRHRGATESSNTGPGSAYRGEYYIYIEASSPRNRGDKAMIYTPAVTMDSGYCLRFFYHMYGYHINELSVVLRQKDDRHRTIWGRTREQHNSEGQMWSSASVAVNMREGESIGFLGVRGTGYSGDIAVDEISLMTGGCRRL